MNRRSSLGGRIALTPPSFTLILIVVVNSRLARQRKCILQTNVAEILRVTPVAFLPLETLGCHSGLVKPDIS